MKHVNFVIILKYRSLCGGSAVIALAVIGLGRLGAVGFLLGLVGDLGGLGG